MTTAYNKHTEGSRVGNWVEENALKAMTGTSRYETWCKEDASGRVPIITKAVGVDKFTDTTKRVIYHSDNQETKDMESTSRDLHNPLKHAAVHQGRPDMGPRARAMQRKLAAEAAAATAAAAERKVQTEWTTAARDAFVRHSDGAYTSPKGRRVMKTMDGVDLPPDCRDSEFLRGAHLSEMRSTLTAEQLEAIAPTSEVASAVPVSIYTQRRAESAFPGTSAASTNPFARNSGFTNDITDSAKQHATAIDDITKRPHGLKPAATTAIGSELSMALAISRLKARLADACGVNGVRALKYAMHKYDTSGDGLLSQEEVAAMLRDLRVGVKATEVAELMAYFDADKSGKLSLTELAAAIQPEISGDRLRAVNAAFSRADRSRDGAITAEELSSLMDFSAHPDVALGIKTASQARRDFLAAFDLVPDGRVTRDEFVSYYTDVGAVVEDDEAFLHMLGRVWGGKAGAAAFVGSGGAKIRVRVIHNDSSEEVVEVSHAGVDKEDLPHIRALLRRAGVKSIHSIYVL